MKNENKIETTTRIVASFVGGQKISADDLPLLIKSVHEGIRTPAPRDEALRTRPKVRRTRRSGGEVIEE